MLPAKLPGGKYLMEIEPSRDGADDLTGDSGAVGRMLVSGTSSQHTCLGHQAAVLAPTLVFTQS